MRYATIAAVLVIVFLMSLTSMFYFLVYDRVRVVEDLKDVGEEEVLVVVSKRAHVLSITSTPPRVPGVRVYSLGPRRDLLQNLMLAVIVALAVTAAIYVVLRSLPRMSLT